MLLRSTVIFSLACVATARKCSDIIVDVALASRNAVFDLDPLETDEQVTSFYLGLSRSGNNYTEELLKGAELQWQNVQGRYKLATTYCEPDSGPGRAIQIMTHGIGFDRSYWDIPYPYDDHSYVARAVDQHGYSTLTWDRLGVGASSHIADTVNELQIFLEIQALRTLSDLARQGRLGGAAQHAYSKVVHVGHSFGSFMTYSLVNQYPNISQGVILTGFTQVPNYQGLFVLGANFVTADSASLASGLSYPAGYIGSGSKTGIQTSFFSPDDLDTDLLDLAYHRAQPHTAGEILTVSSGGGVTNVFAGPVMILTGRYDVPFCGGDCTVTTAIGDAAPNLLAASAVMFPKASVFNATMPSKAGHGINYGKSHDESYDAMLGFFDSNV
ncbi:hypothetical protein GMORB2_4850 [Geosmithia morbida]|uniref:AB hydrolase-1 domain-containing protein n=1 Tax=Geosmithia morbida TaxID=1094350 RepID=A0A9P4YLT4_9HYPO|nr:uncharacterized protein GMORB2_4850 [Geosmithia morbida]KAF4119331.1 hypothetical protein GMORB2_4850 [Geosmithia morbida]